MTPRDTVHPPSPPEDRTGGYLAPTTVEVQDYVTANPDALSRAFDVVVQGLIDQFGLSRVEAHHQANSRPREVLWPFVEAAILVEMKAKRVITIH